MGVMISRHPCGCKTWDDDSDGSRGITRCGDSSCPVSHKYAEEHPDLSWVREELRYAGAETYLQVRKALFSNSFKIVPGDPGPEEHSFVEIEVTYKISVPKRLIQFCQALPQEDRG